MVVFQSPGSPISTMRLKLPHFLPAIETFKRFSSVSGSPPAHLPEIKEKVKQLVLQGQYYQALQIYKDQLHLHFQTISILPSVIKASSTCRQAHQFFGLQLHCHVLKVGSDLELAISNSFVSFYAKFFDTVSAGKVFDLMSVRDVVSWNAMINCYIQNGCFSESLRMFWKMYNFGFVPKPELIASILSVCVQTGCTRFGREIHGLSIVDERIEESVFLSTALVNLYWRCQDSLMAFRVFSDMEVKNEVSWTSMISGFITNNDYDIALHCLREMQVECLKPNRVTLLSVLPACSGIGSIKHGKEVHGYGYRHGFDSDSHFSSALIHMYSNFGEGLRPSKLIFKMSKARDVVLWSAIIASLSTTGEGVGESIMLFNQMQKEGILLNYVTLLAVISACTKLSSISLGRGVHGYIRKSGLNSNMSIGNALIDMYSKCGYLRDSHQTFGEMPIRDSISWSALINAYGLHGFGEEALEIFCEMQERGVEYDAVTFLAVLSACSHAGLVEVGQKLFNEALRDNNLSLTPEHYACYIDLLGKAGKIDYACDVLRTIPMQPSVRIWSSLVSSCKLHGRLEVAKMLLSWLIKSEPNNPANHTLLSLVYAESGKWSGVEESWRGMKMRGLEKNYGFSRLEN